MKISLLFLVASVALTSLSYAQRKVFADSIIEIRYTYSRNDTVITKEKSILYSSVKNDGPDVVLNLRFNKKSRIWDSIYKTSCSYDSLGHWSRKIYCKYDQALHQWNDDRSMKANYDNANNLTSVFFLKKAYPESEGLSMLTEYWYNSRNQIVDEMCSYTDSTGSNSNPVERYSSIYSKDGNRVETENERFDEDINEWTKYSREIRLFSHKNKYSKTDLFFYNNESKLYAPERREEKQYMSGNVVSESKIWFWIKKINKYVLVERRKYSYDAVKHVGLIKEYSLKNDMLYSSECFVTPEQERQGRINEQSLRDDTYLKEFQLSVERRCFFPVESRESNISFDSQP